MGRRRGDTHSPPVRTISPNEELSREKLKDLMRELGMSTPKVSALPVILEAGHLGKLVISPGDSVWLTCGCRMVHDHLEYQNEITYASPTLFGIVAETCPSHSANRSPKANMKRRTFYRTYESYEIVDYEPGPARRAWEQLKVEVHNDRLRKNDKGGAH